ncbi:diguanylate cyclase domain-containing protein [Acetobacterium tundrae]|uniref:Diguanylate cyclase n=1 Tax=Acetobacterium tundrae TaxID=132932 RepID=A0ABR6WKB9_9FIRM|nr:diguanylate cyclase [Acetobacterium tundrae]MBC3796929.1 diguanylate cyclase [Acetobacterium tundrae]
MEWNMIQTMLFTVLFMCFVFYLSMGIFSFKKDHHLKTNIVFFCFCICTSIWAIGYAFMLMSPTIEIANNWRIFAAFGWCFFYGLWFSFVQSFDNKDKKNIVSKIEYLFFLVSAICFSSNFFFAPSQIVSSEPYGFVDNLYTITPIGTAFTIYNAVILLTSMVIIFYKIRNTQKYRIKKQLRIILITCLISVSLALLAELVLPHMGIMLFPSAIITISIGMAGIWYAIGHYKMMSISQELVSKYIFDAVNEPTFIIGEDFLVKNCNKSSISATGYEHQELIQKPLETIIDFREYDFDSIIHTENANKVEVELLRKNKETLVCELTATVILDKYKDILGILILLYDVSEKNKIAELQKQYTNELQEKNVKLRNEIRERQQAEDQIRHFIYYDTLTELYNRKKMLEMLNELLNDGHEKFAILFIDLDHFKQANDNYGHEAGDFILKMVADRLKNIFRSSDIICRIGGDEFIIILRNMKEKSEAEKKAESVLMALSEAFLYKKNKLMISASMGISLFPEHGTDADLLIKKADFAMYEAKREGKNNYKISSS